MTVFQQRASTAIVFSAVMLTGLFWNAWSFHLLFLVIATGCVWEFLELTLPSDAHKKGRKIIGASAGCALVTVIYYASYQFNENTATTLAHPASLIYILLLFSFILLIIELFLKAEFPFNNIALIVFSLFYLALPFSLLTQFATSPIYKIFTPNIVAGVLFLTWANDSFAYLIGSKIGKNPFFLRISPKKTWEGTIGGAVCCMLTAGIIAQFFTLLSLWDWLIIGAIVAVFGTIGDLVESLLKRSVGVKDSGSFMPGHGGFLDRFDAFIFCIPFVYAYLFIVKQPFW